MRLRRLSLLRYGHLSDTVLDFPAEASLCVVLGPNEAGKSTALAALGDALFGFGHLTAFDFLHGAPQLRVGVTLAADGTEASFARRKGRGQTLADGHDQPVTDAALGRFLASTSREQFESMFGLNAERLRQGGQDLARSGGSVGEALFAAGTGLTGLRAALEKLDAEAKSLVGDGRGRRRFNQALDDWQQARRQADALCVQPKAWKDVAETSARIAAELKQVRERLESLGAERSRLERIRRVAPLLTQLDELRRELADLTGAPRMPGDAAESLAKARTTRDQAKRDADRETEAAKRLSDECAQLAPDAKVLAVQDATDELQKKRPIAEQARSDLPEVRQQAASTLSAIQDALDRMGSPLTPEAAADAVPRAHAREALRKLVNEHAALKAKADAALAALESAQTARDEAEAALHGRTAPADPGLLRKTIEDVRGEGRLDTLLADAERVLQETGDRVATALAALPLWNGDAAALAACPLPLPAAAAETAGRLAQAEATANEAAKQARDTDADAAATEVEVARLASGETVPTRDAVASARGRRDALWRVLRDALETRQTLDPATATPQKYEALLSDADELADRRADEAQRVADYEKALARRDTLRESRQTAQTALTEANRVAAEAHAAWRLLWAPCGFESQPPAVMDQWRSQRDKVLALAEKQAEARRQHRDRQDKRDAALSALRSVLIEATVEEAVAAALRRAEVARDAADAEIKAYRELAEARERAAKTFGSAQRTLDRASAALAPWREKWRDAVPPLGLAADCEVESAELALAAWDQIAAAAPLWRESTRRVDDMSGSVEAFERAVADIMQALPTPASTEEASAAAARLMRELAAARAAATKVVDLRDRITQHDEAARSAERVRQDAEAQIVTMCTLAKVEAEDALDDAIVRARRRDAAETEATRLAGKLLAQGDGRDEAALRIEASGTDPDAVQARLGELDEETAELGERRESLSADHARAQATLEEMRQGHDAAGQAQAARNALAAAAAAAERYARLHVARTLLELGMKRFREGQQAPLLQEAGRCFARLTEGRYTRLLPDEQNGQVSLRAVRPGGDECPVEALSDGARDQLYLALRLAAVRSHADSAEKLPFIGDDLLVNFDDARAAAALAELAELGRTTQTILFTHHRHVAELAQAQAGVAVIRFAEQPAQAPQMVAAQ